MQVWRFARPLRVPGYTRGMAMFEQVSTTPLPDGGWRYVVATVEADPTLLDPLRWRNDPAAEPLDGGRGAAWKVPTRVGPAVLRAYRRGGAMRWLGDRYLWLGAERTRAWREFDSLVRARALGLPVPEPLAARWWQTGPFYRASLLTGWIPHRHDLVGALRAVRDPDALGRAVGRVLDALSAQGLTHVDLNARNLLVDAELEVYVIDLDRAVWTAGPAPAGRARMTARLRRSLTKLGVALDRAPGAPFWRALQEHGS